MRNIELPFDITLPPVKSLKAGSLTLDYDSGDLRSIKFGSSEIIRRIYVAVRNENWETAIVSISEEQIKESADGFHIKYKAKYAYQGLEVYEADIELEGTSERVSFHVKGRALQAFKRNRIGICVHHPVRECSGQPMKVTRPDGSGYTSDFPQLISPHQPFKDIKEMRWSPEGVDASLSFEGDTFESEDQRNWGDACYKTYGTPLDIPSPVQLEPGDTIEHKVTLRVKSAAGPPAAKGVDLGAALVSLPFPTLGCAAVSPQRALTAEEIKRLTQLAFHGYRCELRLTDVHWPDLLIKYAKEAGQLGTRLDLVVFFGDDSDLETAQLVEALQRIGPLLASMLVLQRDHKVTPKALINGFYTKVKEKLPSLKVGYGTDAYFTEVNRNRPDETTSFDFLSFHVHPQVHATDSRSIMENVETFPWILKTARSFAQGKAVYVSPLTFSKRNNPDAAREGTGVSEPADGRLHTSFAAKFTLLALAGLAGADKVFVHEAAADKGIVADEATPIYSALKVVKEFQPTSVLQPPVITWSEKIVLKNGKGEELAIS